MVVGLLLTDRAIQFAKCIPSIGFQGNIPHHMLCDLIELNKGLFSYETFMVPLKLESLTMEKNDQYHKL